MSDALLDRLQVAVDSLLEQKRELVERCRQLEQERHQWQEEKAALLVEVGQALHRFDGLDLEGL